MTNKNLQLGKMEKNKNSNKAVGYLLIALGSVFLMIGLLIGGIFFAVGSAMNGKMEQETDAFSSFQENALETTGEVICADSDDGGYTIFKYYAEVDDSWHEVTYDGYFSDYDRGTTVTVYYDKYDPGSCMIPEFTEVSYGFFKNIFTLLGGIVGGVLGIIGLFMLIGGIVVKKKFTPTYEN